MIDYRPKENRAELFTRLYQINLQQGIMPGLVYRYLPQLAHHYGWDDEQKLWFAFLNGMTQNPITSLRMFQHMPEPDPGRVDGFDIWFNEHWANLPFDTDRRHQKRDTVQGVRSYVALVSEYGGNQADIYPRGLEYKQLWKRASSLHGFGRLSTFSYLEYVYIMGFGSDCDDLMFKDKSGSKSHRNGAILLHGYDHLVHDKRMGNGFDGTYDNFEGLCHWLGDQSDKFIAWYKHNYPQDALFAGMFTLETNYCTFKNTFLGRRYPAVYADMAFERILKSEQLGVDKSITDLFREMYNTLPVELQYGDDPRGVAQRGKEFLGTGRPYRAEVMEAMTEFSK